MDARQNFHLRTFTGDAVATPDPGGSTYGLESLYDARAMNAFSDEDARMTNGLAELEARVGPTHRDVATLAQDLARIHFEDENIRKALYLFERAWRVWRQIEGRAGPNLLMCQQELALCLHKDGQHMRADAMYDSAMSGMAEVTERYARAAEKEARATQAAKRHARALELGAVGAGARKGAGLGAGKDVENVPPFRRRTNTAALSAPAPLTDAKAPRAFLRRSKETPLNEFRVKQQRRAPRARTSVTQATTKAFQAASAATAAAKRRQSEDDAAGKPAWRSGGVTQTRRGEKQLTNPFAYGDGRFAGKHR
jgi:murein DD-endopeptidase MepM/ murein hydrolase activator NlpD